MVSDVSSQLTGKISWSVRALMAAVYSCCVGSFWQVLASLYSPPMEISVRTSETVESHVWGHQFGPQGAT